MMGVGQQRGTSRAIIAAVGSVLVLLVLIAYYAAPLPGLSHSSLRGQLKGIEDDLAAKQSRLDTLQRHACPEELEALRVQIAKIEALQDEYEAKLPSTQEIPRVLGNLQSVAGSNGITFERIKTLDVLMEAPYVMRVIEAETRANYFQLIDLCYAMEYGERIATVQGFALQPETGDKGEEPSPGTIPETEAEIKIAIYCLCQSKHS